MRIIKAKLVTASTYDIKYIAKNLEKFLNDFELSDIERRMKAKDIESRLDVGIDKDGKVYNIDLTVDLLRPINDLVAEIQEKLKSGYGDIDFDAYNKLNAIVKWYYLKHKSGNSYTVSSGVAGNSFFMDSLLNVLIYVLTGKVEPDLARVHKEMDKNPDLKSAMYSPSFDVTFMKVKIKKFKNNRIDIKFPKKDQAEKLQALLEAWSKKR